MIFFKNTVCEKDKDIILFEALEDEVKIGSCYLSLKSEYADVFKVEYNSKTPYVVEGLLRSAYNFASLRNFYMGKCTAENIDIFLKRMNFEFINNEYVNDIPSILTGSCSCS